MCWMVINKFTTNNINAGVQASKLSPTFNLTNIPKNINVARPAADNAVR